MYNHGLIMEPCDVELQGSLFVKPSFYILRVLCLCFKLKYLL